MKKIVHLFMCLMVLFLVPGCFNRTVAPDNLLIVGTESNFPPFSSKLNNELIGLDIDIIKEVARRLGKQIEFKDMSFEALLPQAQLGAIHVIAAGMSPTAERKKIVDFTEPHLVGDALFIVTLADSDTKTFDDLRKGKKVVVNQGYTADLFMSKVEGIELIRLETPAEAFLSLKQGRADAYVTARNTLAPFFTCHDAEAFEYKIIPGTDESTALIVSKQYPELLDRIQKQLHGMEQDGTLMALKKKWIK